VVTVVNVAAETVKCSCGFVLTGEVVSDAEAAVVAAERLRSKEDAEAIREAVAVAVCR
jgi:phage terminase large subunit-like protein